MMSFNDFRSSKVSLLSARENERAEDAVSSARKQGHEDNPYVPNGQNVHNQEA
jgi:hypothetical protein